VIVTAARLIFTAARFIVTAARFIVTAARFITTAARFITTAARFIVTATRFNSNSVQFKGRLLIRCHQAFRYTFRPFKLQAAGWHGSGGVFWLLLQCPLLFSLPNKL
jgi:hypothetical protein